MRVIVLCDHAWALGGAEMVALRSAEALASRGHDVHVIGGVRVGEGDVAPPGCTLHPLHQAPLIEAGRRAILRGLWNRRAAALFQRVWEAGDPDDSVVHVHHWATLLSSSVIRRSLSVGAPTVISMHDYGISCPNGGFYNYRTDEICRLDPLSFACITCNCDKNSYAQKLWRVARSTVERVFGHTHDPRIRFVSGSAFAQAIQRRHLPVGASTHLVGYPVMVEPPMAADAHDRGHVLFAGRLSPEKGAELLATAGRIAGATCVFADGGPLEDDLRARFPEHRFLGRVDRGRLFDLMAHARAVAVPSLWYETQGLVAWEAAAIGIPVIAPTETAPGAFVAESGGGVLFHRGDVSSLAHAISTVVADEDAAKELGEAGRRFVLGRDRGLSVHIDGIEAVYRAAIEERRGRVTR